MTHRYLNLIHYIHNIYKLTKLDDKAENIFCDFVSGTLDKFAVSENRYFSTLHATQEIYHFHMKGMI